MVGLLVACSERVEEAPPEPPCDATWASFGDPWFRSWCTACHSSTLPAEDRYGAPLGVDFDTLEAVRAFAPAIRAAATGGAPTMPPGGGPTAEERAALEAWLDCGLPGTSEPPEPGCEAAIPVAGELRLTSADEVARACDAGPIEVGGALLVEVDAELSCVCAVGGDLTIGAAARRVVLPELRSIAGDLVPGAALEELDLRSLATVGDLVLADLQALRAARTGALREVGGSFRLERLPLVGEVDLSRLEAVAADLVLDDLPAVVVLQGEGYALRGVGGDLVLRGMPAWRGFYGFGQLEEVGGDLVVADDDGLTRLDGFTALTRVGGDLVVSDALALRFLDGFDQLEEVGGDLVLARNPALESEDTFAMLARVGGAVRLEELPALVVRQGLTRISGVGSLVVDGLPRTSSLALSSLARCDGALVVSRAGLTSFARPAELTAVGGDLVVEGNLPLVALPGWASLDAVGGDLRVVDNPSLPAAEAEAVAAGVGSVGGVVDVRDNGP